ncbi:MAG TPA: RDD family protein, partial [Candidatus Polarisedimenticolia bacterium]
MNPGEVTESDRGYISEESKRRFTLVAGILGAVFFFAQTVLPMALMFLFMMPMMIGQELATMDIEHAALWREEIWLPRRTHKLNWRDPERSATTVALMHMRLADLSSAGSAIPLEAGSERYPALLPVADRLWVIGTDTVAYYQGGSLTRMNVAGRPPRASAPFVYGGRPALLSLGTPPALATLHVEGPRAEWISQGLSLGLPPEGGALRALQAVESRGRLYLFVQLCTEVPDQCALRYREQGETQWISLVDEICSCGSWTAIALESGPAVFLSEPANERRSRVALVTVGPNGPRQDPIDLTAEGSRLTHTWRPLPSVGRLILVSQGMPGSLRLVEVADGRVLRSVRKQASFPFPFGSTMMLVMMIPQLLPIVLSLLLAFLLTVQMRRHRVQEYVFEGQRRSFASLWQRALAQLVDVVPFLAGFLLPMASWWRMFSDPERFLEGGPFFPLVFFGLFIGAFFWAVVVLLAFSYLEGRFGKTPGKWLLGIRVLGTDLQPCGFRRAFLRNLLTFVDGFFSFLVGALLVALTE